MLREGAVIVVVVTFVADYALWGRTARGELGMVPLPEMDDDEPLPEPGDRLRVRVVRILNPVGQEQHSDVTWDGRIRRVDFLGTMGEGSGERGG